MRLLIAIMISMPAVTTAEDVSFRKQLAPILARRGKLAPDLAVEYGRQISRVLEFLHQNEVIHSKLTPDKIIITKDHKVKVADLRLNRSKRRRWDATRRRLSISRQVPPQSAPA